MAVIDVNEDGRWHVPAASCQAKDPRRATTLYASNQDAFIFLVDERNPVSVHVEGTVRRAVRRTVWELVNGGTAVARSIPHNGDRVGLERRVSGTPHIGDVEMGR